MTGGRHQARVSPQARPLSQRSSKRRTAGDVAVEAVDGAAFELDVRAAVVSVGAVRKNLADVAHDVVEMRVVGAAGLDVNLDAGGQLTQQEAAAWLHERTRFARAVGLSAWLRSLRGIRLAPRAPSRRSSSSSTTLSISSVHRLSAMAMRRMNSPPISPGGWITVFLMVAMVSSSLLPGVGAEALLLRGGTASRATDTKLLNTDCA